MFCLNYTHNNLLTTSIKEVSFSPTVCLRKYYWLELHEENNSEDKF